MLPYRLKSTREGEFIAEKSFSSPAFLYANLDARAQSKTYNFVWVGIVATKNKLSLYEEEQASKVLQEKHCYAIFATEDELRPFLRFYERLLRPNMHNFVDPSDFH